MALSKSFPALLLAAGLTAACTGEPAPPPQAPAETFSDVATVDALRLTPGVEALEETTKLATAEEAAAALGSLPASAALLDAYEELAGDEELIVWVKLVATGCLPPLDIAPVKRGETVDFLVIHDPQNATVDCARLVPTVALVAVN